MPTEACYWSITDRNMSNSYSHILADIFSFDLHLSSIFSHFTCHGLSHCVWPSISVDTVRWIRSRIRMYLISRGSATWTASSEGKEKLSFVVTLSKGRTANSVECNSDSSNSHPLFIVLGSGYAACYMVLWAQWVDRQWEPAGYRQLFLEVQWPGCDTAKSP